MKIERWNGYAPVGLVAVVGMILLTALFVAPAIAQETTTNVETDGSARTISGGFEHIAAEGPPAQDIPPSAAAGTITPIGPFVGDESEGFFKQVIGDPFPTCVEDRVFNDMGDLCSSGGCAHITPSWGFACVIFPHDTPRLYGSCDGFSIYTFDTPVTRFGGYFGSNAPGNPTGVANFYDADNVLIDTVDITIAPNCEWTWSGWEVSGNTVAKVEVVSDVFGGAFIQMDDMELSFSQGGGGGPCEDPAGECAETCPAENACQSDADCGPGSTCTPWDSSLPCISSSCFCDNGDWACTDDCAPQCISDPGVPALSARDALFLTLLLGGCLTLALLLRRRSAAVE